MGRCRLQGLVEPPFPPLERDGTPSTGCHPGACPAALAVLIARFIFAAHERGATGGTTPRLGSWRSGAPNVLERVLPRFRVLAGILPSVRQACATARRSWVIELCRGASWEFTRTHRDGPRHMDLAAWDPCGSAWARGRRRSPSARTGPEALGQPSPSCGEQRLTVLVPSCGEAKGDGAAVRRFGLLVIRSSSQAAISFVAPRQHVRIVALNGDDVVPNGSAKLSPLLGVAGHDATGGWA